MSIFDDARNILKSFQNKPQPKQVSWTVDNPMFKIGQAALKPFENFEGFLNSSKSFQLPQVPQAVNNNFQIKTPVGNIQPIQMARDVANTIVSQGVINPAFDIGRTIAAPLTGRDTINYQTAKSPAAQLGMNIGSFFSPQGGQSLRVNNSPQQVIGNIAGAAIPPLTAYGGNFIPNLGKAAIEQTFKQGLLQTAKNTALQGGAGGGIYGLLNGLAEGKNGTLPSQVLEGLKQGGMGVVAGLIGGGVLGAGGYTYGAIRNKLTDMLVQNHGFNPKQARDVLGRFAKYEAKRVAKGLPPQPNEPVWVGDIRESVGLPRHGDYPELPQPGLSVKYVGEKTPNGEISPTTTTPLPQQPEGAKLSSSLPSQQNIPQKPMAHVIDEEIAKLQQQIGEKLAGSRAQSEIGQSTWGMFGSQDIQNINRLKAMSKGKAFQSGDIETLRKQNPKLLEGVINAIKERNPQITDDTAALDYALRLPTQSQLRVKIPPESAQLKSLKGIAESGVIPGNNGVSAFPTSKTLGRQSRNESKAAAQAAKADYAQWQKTVMQQEGATQTIGGAVKQAVGAVKGNTTSPLSNPAELKDISGFNAGFRDLYRNFKAVYGKNFTAVKEGVLDPFDASKGRFIDEQKKWTTDLSSNVVKKFGINKGSKESAAVQQFGEGNRDYGSLVKEFGKRKADNIVEANKWFRSSYDQLLNEVNQVRSAVYPNQPDKIIPKRDDYYRHFTELSEGFKGLFNIFETPSGIGSKMAGVSYNTEPKSKFLSFAQKRLGLQTTEDAVGGFLDYLKSAAYAKTVDPQISKFRYLADEIASNTAEGEHAGKLNNFVTYLNRFADDLAGKTNPADRIVQEWIPGGRTTFRAINWLNSRVKANTILGNVSSTVAQIFNVPQGIAEAGPINASKGLGRSLAGMFNPDNPMKKSVFLKERYFNSYDQFDQGMVANTKKFASWMTSVLDEVGSKYIWNSMYEKALAQGVDNPVKYADSMTRNMVAGRGIGEVPLAQKSKLFQLVAPFQLEVGNLWHVMGDMVGEKAFGKLATLFIANYIFNKGAEAVRGSAVTFDPIQATLDALGEFQKDPSGQGALKAGGRLAGEALSNIPLGQTVAGAYPEFGFKAGDTQFPTRKELFGKSDPTRFGSGLVAAKGLQDPLFKVLPPFGGGQVKKTIEGLSAYKEGASVTPKGNVRYEIPQTPSNLVKSALFGQYATPEARDYFANQGVSKAESIISQFNKVKTPEEKAQVWDQMVQNKTITKENVSDIKKLLNDQKMGITSKEVDIRNLQIKDGSRPRAIIKEFNKLKTPEEKAALWDKYVQAKIITPEVSKQIKEQLVKKQGAVIKSSPLASRGSNIAYAGVGGSPINFQDSPLRTSEGEVFKQWGNGDSGWYSGGTDADLERQFDLFRKQVPPLKIKLPESAYKTKIRYAAPAYGSTRLS